MLSQARLCMCRYDPNNYWKVRSSLVLILYLLIYAYIKRRKFKKNGSSKEFGFLKMCFEQQNGYCFTRFLFTAIQDFFLIVMALRHCATFCATADVFTPNWWLCVCVYVFVCDSVFVSDCVCVRVCECE